jgi:aminocarboxymuconate-semialdehyde decarboxylase
VDHVIQPAVARVGDNCVSDTVGVDRVMLGTDYPFDMADPDPVESVRACGLGAEAEEAILAGNAERLLGLERATKREIVR